MACGGQRRCGKFERRAVRSCCDQIRGRQALAQPGDLADAFANLKVRCRKILTKRLTAATQLPRQEGFHDWH